MSRRVPQMPGNVAFWWQSRACVPDVYRRVGASGCQRHRASPHREARPEATTPRRPEMRAQTIATKASTIVPGGILALGLAVVLMGATASTASAGTAFSRARAFSSGARPYRRSTTAALMPVIVSTGAPSTSATGRSERRARRRAFCCLRVAPSTPASASPATTSRPVTAHRRWSTRAASSGSPSPPRARGPRRAP